MSCDDNKALYSKASKYYVEVHAGSSEYKKSKKREEKHNKDWNERKVNINEIIDRFTPNFTAKTNGQKMIFEGEKYVVVTDMAAGYLRVYDIEKGGYIKLDGSLGTDKETHFKIKKREEM